MKPLSAVTVGRAFAKSSRPQNIVFSGLLAAIAAYYSSDSLFVAAAAYVAIAGLYALAATVNNLADLKTDKLNKRRDNPFTALQIPRSQQFAFGGLVLLLLAACQFALEQPVSLMIAASMLLLAGLYSHPKVRISARGWWGIALLAVSYGSLPLLLGQAQAGGWESGWLLPAALAGLLLVPVLSAKDYKDRKGDAATGKLTPLVRYGVRHVWLVSVATAAAAVVLTGWYTIASNGPAPLHWWVAAFIYSNSVWRLHGQQGKLDRLQKALLMATILILVLTA